MGDNSTAGEEANKKRIRIASCEPCRTSKLACDHVQPVCSRCIKRGIPGECVYRENPFKRMRTSAASRPSEKTRSVTPLDYPQINHGLADHQTHSEEPTPISPPNVALTPSQFPSRLYPNPGFLGSSSLTAVFNELGTHAELGMDTKLEPGTRRADEAAEMTRGAVLAMNDAIKIEEGANILNLFLDSLRFDTFLDLFNEWWGRGIELNLGTPYIVHFVEAITNEIQKLRQSHDRKASLLNLSRRLFDNGNKPLLIHGSMTLKEFCNQYTGENLRWETVGCILTFIGMAAIEVTVPHAICRTEEERQRIRMQMVEAGDTCIGFCESFDNLNDVQIVLLFLNCLLHSLFDGDQSFKTWRRLNDVTSALFAFGLHEDFEQGPDFPFFLVQLRKRVFARVYASDIGFSAFLGRPPRVSKRFCCLHLPLDMDEDTYNLEGDALTEELTHYDQNGWNTKGEIRKSAVVRWSMMTAMIREDLLELLLGKNTTNVPERITQIKIENDQAWDSLPPFLKIGRHELWYSEKIPRELDTLHIIKLLHLHNLFLTERAITRHSHERSDACVAIASEMLGWVNDAIVRRERLSKLGLSGLAWKVVAYSLPAAGVLALELLQQSRRKWANGIETIPRSQTIQDLSVLIVHMDVLVGPGDGNYQLFRQAKRALQSIMDIILAPQVPKQYETPSTASSNGFPLNDWVLYEQWGFDGDFWSSLADHPLLTEPEMNNAYS